MYELVVQAVLNHPWAILPEKLKAIEALLSLRASGGHVGAEDIAAATNGRRNALPQPAGNVMVIPIYGTIHQHAGLMAESSGGVSVDGIRKALRGALADGGVSAIVLDVDSPGGSVFGVPELAEEIRGMRGTKPIVAIANSLAASAAYWLASAADELWMTPSGIVGSIGVYMAHVDMSKAYEQAGMKVTYISAGKYKTEGNDTEPLADEARASYQADVDAYYGMFVADVAKGRQVAASAVRDDYGEGRTVMAGPALKAGMVDHIGTLDDAIRQAATLARKQARVMNAEATTRAILAGL